MLLDAAVAAGTLLHAELLEFGHGVSFFFGASLGAPIADVYIPRATAVQAHRCRAVGTIDFVLAGESCFAVFDGEVFATLWCEAGHEGVAVGHELR